MKFQDAAKLFRQLNSESEPLTNNFCEILNLPLNDFVASCFVAEIIED